MTQVNVLDAMNRLSQLIMAAAAGEEVIIADCGVPVAKLVAISPGAETSTGRSLVVWLTANPLPHYSARERGDRGRHRRAAKQLGLIYLDRRLLITPSNLAAAQGTRQCGPRSRTAAASIVSCKNCNRLSSG